MFHCETWYSRVSFFPPQAGDGLHVCRPESISSTVQYSSTCADLRACRPIGWLERLLVSARSSVRQPWNSTALTTTLTTPDSAAISSTPLITP